MITEQQRSIEELEKLLNNFHTSEVNPNDRINYKDLSSKNRKRREYGTEPEFRKHNDEIRNYIIKEYKSKMILRNVSYYVIVAIVIALITFIFLFMFNKSDEAHLSLLLTLTVAVFGNLFALISIIFKYVFSSTTELTDYAKILLEHELTTTSEDRE